jgi:hypothetical protein
MRFHTDHYRKVSVFLVVRFQYARYFYHTSPLYYQKNFLRTDYTHHICQALQRNEILHYKFDLTTVFFSTLNWPILKDSIFVPRLNAKFFKCPCGIIC